MKPPDFSPDSPPEYVCEGVHVSVQYDRFHNKVDHVHVGCIDVVDEQLLSPVVETTVEFTVKILPLFNSKTTNVACTV